MYIFNVGWWKIFLTEEIDIHFSIPGFDAIYTFFPNKSFWTKDKNFSGTSFPTFDLKLLSFLVILARLIIIRLCLEFGKSAAISLKVTLLLIKEAFRQFKFWCFQRGLQGRILYLDISSWRFLWVCFFVFKFQENFSKIAYSNCPFHNRSIFVISCFIFAQLLEEILINFGIFNSLESICHFCEAS